MKRILSFMLVLCFLTSAVICVSAEDNYMQTPTNPTRYAEKVFEKYNVDINSDEFSWEYYFYEELYDYYSIEEVASYEDSTPDYVLISANSCFIVDTPLYEYIGPYIVIGARSMWGTCGFHIYFPAEDKLCSLEEAYNSGLEGIDEAIIGASEASFGGLSLFGDANDDDVLNIKDVTHIQKLLVGILNWNDKWYTRRVSDFDCDKNNNIKDATAIQKYIAGLEY